MVARQRIHIGARHAGQTLDIEEADNTWRIYDSDLLLTEVPRTTTKAIARFKVRKPEPPRRTGAAGSPTTAAEPGPPSATSPQPPTSPRSRMAGSPA
jgi:hypothetical protein